MYRLPPLELPPFAPYNVCLVPWEGGGGRGEGGGSVPSGMFSPMDVILSIVGMYSTLGDIIVNVRVLNIPYMCYDISPWY